MPGCTIAMLRADAAALTNSAHAIPSEPAIRRNARGKTREP
jgi:hypothetical protein